MQQNQRAGPQGTTFGAQLSRRGKQLRQTVCRQRIEGEARVPKAGRIPGSVAKQG